MTSSPPALLDLVLESLERASAVDADQQPHARAFVAWILLPVDTAANSAALETLSREASTEGPGATAQAVAALGFAAAGLPRDRIPVERLGQGLTWLKGRQYFAPHRPRGFEADGIALLGVALGVSALGDGAEQGELRSWLAEMLTRSLAETAPGSWHCGLMLAAEMVLAGRTAGVAASAPFPADLRAALTSQGLCDLSEDEERRALEMILSIPQHRADGASRAATQRAALAWLFRSRPTLRLGQPSVAEVVKLLERVEHSMRRWTWEDKPRTRGGVAVNWDIRNEYHVQDLLWAILAPLFPDLEDEEQLPSLGHKHPRADLGIPSLRLIIEVKFVYDGTRAEFAKIIGEVAEDTGLYLAAGSGYSEIVAFIWDNSAHGEEHEEIKQGLLRLSGVPGAIVLSRPGKMKDRP